MKKHVHSRREFINRSLKTTLAISFAPAILPAYTSSIFQSTIKVGFVGTGLRGRNHLKNLLDNKDVECTAICDIDQEAIDASLQMIDKAGKQKPEVYSKNEYSYLDMLNNEELDAVIIATNWRWHTPISLAAMEAGVYTGLEVAGAFSVDECWQLVRTHEATGTPLFFLENVCYRRDVMAVLGMVRDGLFGELLHCRGGYQHDLRHVKFNTSDGKLLFGNEAKHEAKWRTQHSVDRNGELYPTHGLGPIMHQLDINCGNRLTRLSSFASKARSLNDFIKKHPNGGDNHTYTEVDWKLGDIVTTHIATANGETILLTHDTNSPRPYSLGFRTQGANGLVEFDYYMSRVHIEGESSEHKWDEADKWFSKYDHPLWKKYEETAVGGGHGGMDYFMNRQFVEDVKNARPATIDVYDGVAMKVITPLSEQSIANGGEPQDIPDFTSGKWMVKKPYFAYKEDF